MIFFPRQSAIQRQIKQFVEAKLHTQGWPSAINHKEHLNNFVAVAKVKSVFDIEPQHVNWYRMWLMDRYMGTYTVEKAITSVNALLAFYHRYDILHDMHITRRPPNLEMIKIVKDYRAKNMPFRDIKAILERRAKDGKRYDLKTLWFWAHYKVKKLSTA